MGFLKMFTAVTVVLYLWQKFLTNHLPEVLNKTIQSFRVGTGSHGHSFTLWIWFVLMQFVFGMLLQNAFSTVP